MRVLITGAAGFIGSHLCERFLNEGHEVIGLDNFLTGSPDNINHLLGREEFRFLKYDVTNYISIPGKIDLILHFACPASPVDYMNYPIHTMKVDSIGTLHTLGLAKATGARYLLASTSEVYGDPLVHPQPETYWGNVNPIGVRSVYDEAKRFSEALSSAYCRVHGIDVRIARIFNTYGPRMRANDGRVVPNFITQALQGNSITVYGDGTQTRSFCYIDDMVEGIFCFATMDNLKGTVINLGNPDEYNILKFAEIIIELTGSKSELAFHPLPEDDPRTRNPDITKAKSMLHWQPRITLNQGITETIKYFQARDTYLIRTKCDN